MSLSPGLVKCCGSENVALTILEAPEQSENKCFLGACLLSSVLSGPGSSQIARYPASKHNVDKSRRGFCCTEGKLSAQSGRAARFRGVACCFLLNGREAHFLHSRDRGAPGQLRGGDSSPSL